MVAIQALTTLLLASVAIAVPAANVRRDARISRRASGRSSQPKIPASGGLTPSITNQTNVDYSSNWSGAVITKSKGTWKSVTGTFTVPTPSGSGSASAWVGIDGDTCGTAILQTGIDFTVSGGSVSYDSWYEWYPDYAYDFSGISFSSGDTVKLTVTASSTKAGTAVIENVTKGKTVTKSITSSSALCQEDAEWIVEDYEEGSSLVQFANFGTVAFTGAVATTNAGATYGPSSATDTIDIEQNNKVLTSVSTSSSGVTVKYV
ncbi:hypothetical protein HWV62_31907 [Athelia sp. TMB]|nr:hypothetical protein HWV62_31907 [Athelia sp. TMB]